jgi:hypothetical protein
MRVIAQDLIITTMIDYPASGAAVRNLNQLLHQQITALTLLFAGPPLPESLADDFCH